MCTNIQRASLPLPRLTNSDSIMQTLFEFSLLISADAFFRRRRRPCVCVATSATQMMH